MAFSVSSAHPWRDARRLFVALAIAAVALAGLVPGTLATARAGDQGTYRNPLDISSDVGPVENCADPTVAKQRKPNGSYVWWMYCTKDPRNDQDVDNSGDPVFQLIPIYSSRNLVDWKHRGNVFQPAGATGSNYPEWAAPDAGLFAPEIKRMNGQWYLYYSVTDMADDVSPDPEAGCPRENTIGVATAPHPAGPWTDSGDPVIDPRLAFPEGNPDEPCANAWYWTIDPEIQRLGDTRYIFWGSYFGGIFVRQLTPDGFETVDGTEQQITTANKFEGPDIIKRDGWYYLFVSATNCCNGDLTAYGVFAGRSRSLFGPYVDRSGQHLLETDDSQDPSDAEVGGSTVLQMNGNRWMGVGHNTVFRDFAGRHWTIYHAVNRNDPTFAFGPPEDSPPDPADDPGFTKRPALLDPIAWVNGWPRVNGGQWASTGVMPAPAAQPGQQDLYQPMSPWSSGKNRLLEEYSDEFNGTSLDPRWEWINGEPPSGDWSVSGGLFRLVTQNRDLFKGCCANPSILAQDAPDGQYLLEARIHVTVPSEGCCYNFRQGGLLIYDDNDAFLKLVEFANWETRQTEWAKEVPAGDPGSRYGNGVVGPPGEWTTLRIVKADHSGGGEFYQAWTRRDGGPWERGATWRYDELGDDSLIGLVSMAAGGPLDQNIRTELHVDWIRVYDLRLDPPQPIDES